MPTVIPAQIRGLTVDLQYSFQKVLLSGRIEEGFWVDGLSNISANSSTFTGSTGTNATLYMQGQVPVGTAHPDFPLCTARYYNVRPDNSSTGVLVIVTYVYDSPTGNQTVYSIETDNTLEYVETDQQINTDTPIAPTTATITSLNLDGTSETTTVQVFANQGLYKPIKIDNYQLNWTSQDDTQPSDPPENPAYGVVSCLRPRKRWTYSKTILSKSAADQFDYAGTAFTGMVNGVVWNNCPVGTVMIFNAGVIYTPNAGQYLARAQFVYRPEGWNPWVRFSNLQLGTPPNLWRALLDTTGTVTKPANGIIQATEYFQVDINTYLLNLI